MKAVLAVVVALLVLGALAQKPPPTKGHAHPKGGPAHPAAHHPSDGKGFALKIAKDLKTLLGDADGSAEFKNGTAVPGTVAKKAVQADHQVGADPKKKIGKHVGADPKKQTGKPGLDEKVGKGAHGGHPGTHGGIHKLEKNHSALFDFKHVKPGTNAVGIQKSSYKPQKHGSLVSKFCNDNPDVTLVLSVKQIKHANGTTHKKVIPGLIHHHQKVISGLTHQNFFLVLNGAVVYPSGAEHLKHHKAKAPLHTGSPSGKPPKKGSPHKPKTNPPKHL